MVDVLPIFVTPIPSMLHQNNIGVTYAWTSNFKMEQVRSMPLYSVAMPQSIIIVTKVVFALAPVHIVDGARSRP